MSSNGLLLSELRHGDGVMRHTAGGNNRFQRLFARQPADRFPPVSCGQGGGEVSYDGRGFAACFCCCCISMAHCYCYVLEPDRHISSRHDLEAADDVEAMLKASQVVPPSEGVPTIEVGLAPGLSVFLSFDRSPAADCRASDSGASSASASQDRTASTVLAA